MNFYQHIPIIPQILPCASARSVQVVDGIERQNVVVDVHSTTTVGNFVEHNQKRNSGRRIG
jgi:hypothetical protein